MIRKSSFFIILLLLIAVCASSKAVGAEYKQLRGVIHVHSDFSSGKYSISKLAAMAKKKQLEVLILTDHDLVAMEYGIYPFRNLVKKREERKSIIRTGPEKYLAAINRVNADQDDVLLIPGVQSSPFYYWTGNPLNNNLTAHNYRKELLLIGLEEPEDYKNLPLLHNGFSTRYFRQLAPRSLVFGACMLIGLALIFYKGWLRYTGGLIFLVGLAMSLNHHPFQSSRFDPYHGEQGIAPYQEAIDYVVGRGGLVFWAHPESVFSKDGQKIGPITLKTPPYPQDLILSDNYTGFSILYGEKTIATDPGQHWDKLLKSYCLGVRNKPAWGIAGSDFHDETAWLKLDTLQTVFLARDKSKSAVMEALAAGRSYAVLKTGQVPLALERFSVTDTVSGKSAILGESLRTGRKRMVEGRVVAAGNEPISIELTVVRDGKPWQKFKGRTPLEFHFADNDAVKVKTYYRLAVDAGREGRLLTNPIFVFSAHP